jgi:hypothetical protein
MNHEATARVVIDMPRDEAWDLLKDLSLAHHYVPRISRTEITTVKTQGLGASRRVYPHSGTGVDESVIEWNEGHGLVLRLHNGDKISPVPFSRAVFRYRLDDAGHNRTALTASLVFDMRWGRLGRFLYQRFLHRVIRGEIRDVAISMKRFYESGEPVTADQLKPLRAAARQEV